jgi:hypothetical protein
LEGIDCKELLQHPWRKVGLRLEQVETWGKEVRLISSYWRCSPLNQGRVKSRWGLDWMTMGITGVNLQMPPPCRLPTDRETEAQEGKDVSKDLNQSQPSTGLSWPCTTQMV